MPAETARGECEVRVVVGVVPELARVFSTKMRAPFMVPLQTVLLSEVRAYLADQKPSKISN
jgi:hypothetical protein